LRRRTDAKQLAGRLFGCTNFELVDRKGESAADRLDERLLAGPYVIRGTQSSGESQRFEFAYLTVSKETTCQIERLDRALLPYIDPDLVANCTSSPSGWSSMRSRKW
jgi:hypothetical protein